MMYFQGRYCKQVFLFLVNVHLPKNPTMTLNNSLTKINRTL